MDLAGLTSMDIRSFTEELTKLEIREVEIPKFYIPNWPEAAGSLDVNLGKRRFLFATETPTTGLLMLVPKKKKLVFNFNQNGVIRARIFSFNYCSFTSNSYDNIDRIQTLLLFQQFKDELFAAILRQLKTDIRYHIQAAEMIKQAFEPFIPFVVMEQLSS